MLDFITNLLGYSDRLRNFGSTRSNEWPRVRAEHLLKEPACQVTGATNDLEVHHIRPFHLHPELELDPNNLITLTTNFHGLNVHLIYGHFRNFRTKFNRHIREEAPIWKARFDAKEMNDAL